MTVCPPEMQGHRDTWGAGMGTQRGPRWGLDGTCQMSGANGSREPHLPSQGPPSPPLPVPPRHSPAGPLQKLLLSPNMVVTRCLELAAWVCAGREHRSRKFFDSGDRTGVGFQLKAC